MEGSLRESDLNVTLPRTTNNSITLAKLLKNVEKSYEKGKKLLDHSRILDENGEPLVLYRGQMSHANVPFVNHGDGIYFTPDRKAAIGYGADHNPIPVFLNALNPYEVDFDGDSDTEENDYHADIRGEYHYAREEDFDILIATNTFDGENELDQYVVHEDAQVKRIDLIDLSQFLSQPYNKTNEQPRFHFSGETDHQQLDNLNHNDVALRDRLIMIMQSAGIVVNTNWQEGQAVIDAAGSQIKMMADREKENGEEIQGNKKTVDSRQWAQVRSDAFKNWYGDWQNGVIFTANYSTPQSQTSDPMLLRQ